MSVFGWVNRQIPIPFNNNLNSIQCKHIKRINPSQFLSTEKKESPYNKTQHISRLIELSTHIRITTKRWHWTAWFQRQKQGSLICIHNHDTRYCLLSFQKEKKTKAKIDKGGRGIVTNDIYVWCSYKGPHWHYNNGHKSDKLVKKDASMQQTSNSKRVSLGWHHDLINSLKCLFWEITDINIWILWQLN